MRYLKIFIVSIILVYPTGSYAQISLLSLGVWNISALSGEFKLGGLYGAGDINTYGINNKQTTTDYYGGVMLKTSSFIWNPSFLTVDIDGGYYPESRQDLYLVSPNIYNAINTTKLHLGGTLFPKKMITLSGHLNYDNSYDSRENLTDIKTNSQSQGGTFSYRNNVFPITFSYDQNKWDSREILTGNQFTYNQKNFTGRVNKAFGKRDRNDLLYTHNDYTSNEYNIYNIRNVSDNIQLQDGFFLDSSRRSQYNSTILGTNQRGTDSLTQLRVNESMFLRLPYRLTFNTNYSYSYLLEQPEKLQENNVSVLLGHQLYESLHSGLLYEYNNSLETSYHEEYNKVGLELNYTKKTFAKGLLNIQYSYNLEFENMKSAGEVLSVVNEEYSITDMVTLKRPYVNPATIQIKDATSTVIYQLNLDYVVTTVGDMTQIQRIPGGQIQNNSNIFVSYSASQPGNYSYNLNMNNFSINYSFFNNLLDFYYKTTKSDYTDIRNTDNLLLNYLNDDLYGACVKYKTATLGSEYDDYQSNLVPYFMVRYYFTWQGKIRENVVFSINANWRDYKLPTESEHRLYGDFNGMLSYAVNKKSKIDVTLGYQSQEGQQINLDLVTLRTKYSTMIRKLVFVVGVDGFDRVYLSNQKTDYLGAYVQIVKKFKY